MTEKKVVGTTGVDSVLAQAKQEFAKEQNAKYVQEYKSLLKRRADAQKLVDNINREIEDLELKMRQEIGD